MGCLTSGQPADFISAPRPLGCLLRRLPSCGVFPELPMLMRGAGEGFSSRAEDSPTPMIPAARQR